MSVEFKCLLFIVIAIIVSLTLSAFGITTWHVHCGIGALVGACIALIDKE